MTEPTIYAIAVAIALIAQIVLQVLARLDAAKAAAKAEEVKKDLETANTATGHKLNNLAEAVDETKKTGQLNHLLLNSAMAAALKTAAVALRRIADDKKEEGDIKAAEIAEMALAEHVAKQKTADDSLLKG